IEAGRLFGRSRLDRMDMVVDGNDAAGDFGHRISKDYEEDNLNQFAGNINTLLSSVDAGIGETRRVVASLAEGDLTQTMSGN
ncbi:hypothetical protein ACC677_37950, partial [Rhizobium ruizarguesonis]